MTNNTLKILVIDDSEDDRLLYRRTLQKTGAGHTVSEAADGEEGLKRLQLEHPDCVLLDYSMPGRNGVEILKRIRARHPFVPVVILTGQGNETVAVTAMKAGAQDYISKTTITPETLEHTIRMAIEHAILQKHVQEQRSSLEIFAHALAHDLKEPTNTIASFVGLILDDEHSLSDKGIGYFYHVRKAAERMQRLIETVSLYTRIDAQDEVIKEICPIGEVLQETKENLAQLIRDGKATITQENLPTVAANRTQMLQLLQNLVANAIRHGGEHVYIHVATQEHPDHWVVYVRDNGPGIERQHMEKIFEPFKRMSNPKDRGLGLGLAISRKIVESHGGKIWCESTPGLGSTFFFTLPKSVPVKPNLSLASSNASVKKSSDKKSRLARILLVDDNEADVALNKIMLIEQSRMQCEVLTATDGREALEMLRKYAEEDSPIDLVVLDINMPVMSGFELLAAVQREASLVDTMVIMCTTSAFDLDKQMAKSMGAAGYLMKPPQFLSFKALVDKNPRLSLQQEGNAYLLKRAS